MFSFSSNQSRHRQDRSVRGRLAALRLKRRKKQQRGVALLMVLGTLSVLTVMLTEFQDATSAEMGSSASARDQVKAEYAARSAVNLTRLLIASEPTVRGALGPLFLMMSGGKKKPPQIPVWEFTDIILGAFAGEENQEVFSGLSGLDLSESRNLGMENASFEIVVVDEDSKINLNIAARADVGSKQRIATQLEALLAPPQFDELFSELDEEGDLHDRQTVCGAIVDWADPDTEREPCTPRVTTPISAGAEDSYYAGLSPRYERKNAAYDSLEELRMVRGISDDFWRTFVQPDPDDPKSRVITVWGSGLVNVNTANPQTMLSMACSGAFPADQPLCVDPVQQAKLLASLAMIQQFTGGVPVFNSAKSFTELVQGKGQMGPMLIAQGVTPLKVQEKVLQDAVTTESKVFSIIATGMAKSGRRETRTKIHAVVDFRAAPPPGTADDFAKFQQLKEAGGFQSTGNPDEDEKNNPYLQPSPAGTVIYYRVD